jgi:hypothetical protein
MPVLKNIAAIAKGMSITFMEMFQPTTVENYPDGKGPLRGARIEARFRGAHVLQRDENGLENASPAFCARPTAHRTASISRQPITLPRTASAEPSATPRFITSITTAASFAAIAWKLAPPTRSRTVTVLSWLRLTPAIWFTARSRCWLPRPAHMGANVVFNQADVDGGAPKEMVAGS